MSAHGARTSVRNPAIDVLRAWAVLAVLALHLNIRVPFNGCALGRSLPKPLYAFLFWSGYPAVIVFFVVSGFLISNMTVERWGALERCDVANFYRRRFARLSLPWRCSCSCNPSCKLRKSPASSSSGPTLRSLARCFQSRPFI